MIDATTDPLECFGRLEKVFPMGEDGLRSSPAGCMACPMKTPCIQAAMRGSEGLEMQEKRIDQAYERGMIGTLERWSRKKLIRKKMEEASKKPKGSKKDSL